MVKASVLPSQFKQKKGAPKRTPLVLLIRLVIIPLVIFACGLICTEGERTRPGSFFFSFQRLGAGLPRSGTSYPRFGRTDGPTYNRAQFFSYTLTCRRMCCTSCRCRCAPACSCRIRRKDHPRSPAFWPCRVPRCLWLLWCLKRWRSLA